MQQTLKNLTKAFIGECQARNRYTYYAKIAKKEGYEQIGEIFLETANHEKEHAKRIFEHIQELKEKLNIDKDEEINVEISAPTDYGTTIENLKASIKGENHENSVMYPEFAEIAEKEELFSIASRLRAISISEMHHEDRYQKLLKQLESGTIFKKSEEIEWACAECGYIHNGNEPPEKCPSCDHPKSFYYVKCEKY